MCASMSTELAKVLCVRYFICFFYSVCCYILMWWTVGWRMKKLIMNRRDKRMVVKRKRRNSNSMVSKSVCTFRFNYIFWLVFHADWDFMCLISLVTYCKLEFSQYEYYLWRLLCWIICVFLLLIYSDVMRLFLNCGCEGSNF